MAIKILDRLIASTETANTNSKGRSPRAEEAISGLTITDRQAGTRPTPEYRPPRDVGWIPCTPEDWRTTTGGSRNCCETTLPGSGNPRRQQGTALAQMFQGATRWNTLKDQFREFFTLKVLSSTYTICQTFLRGGIVSISQVQQLKL